MAPSSSTEHDNLVAVGESLVMRPAVLTVVLLVLALAAWALVRTLKRQERRGDPPWGDGPSTPSDGAGWM